MNIFKYLFSSSYRKHRWAARHLRLYRTFTILLQSHKIQRMPSILSPLIEAQYTYDVNKGMKGLVRIPKFSDLTGEKLDG